MALFKAPISLRVTNLLVIMCFLWTWSTCLAGTPTRLLTMPDVIRALTQGAPVRVQIRDISKCQTKDLSSVVPFANFAHDVETARVKRTSDEKVNVLVTTEMEVKGQELNMTGSVLRQISLTIKDDGTMGVNVTNWRPLYGYMITTWKRTCQWNNATSKDSAVIYQQDAWGEEMSEFQSLKDAVLTGYAFAVVLDLSIVNPPSDGLWIGKIRGMNLRQYSAISFHQRWPNGTSLTVMSLTVLSTDSVIIDDLTFQRPSGHVVNFAQRHGFFNFKGSVHLFKLSYET